MPRSLGSGQGKMSKNSYFTLFLFLCDCIPHKPKQSRSSKGQVYLISRSYQHQQERNQFSVYFKCLCDLCYADGKPLMERNSCYMQVCLSIEVAEEIISNPIPFKSISQNIKRPQNHDTISAGFPVER